jgi:hypothetical protein
VLPGSGQFGFFGNFGDFGNAILDSSSRLRPARNVAERDRKITEKSRQRR